jgi:hypothetical protein
MVTLGKNGENEGKWFLAGNGISDPPPPPSLNADRPGGSEIVLGPWISMLKSRPLEFA